MKKTYIALIISAVLAIFSPETFEVLSDAVCSIQEIFVVRPMVDSDSESLITQQGKLHDA
jgi:hypothetical protein